MILESDFLFLMFQHSDLLSMSSWHCWNLFFCDYRAKTKLNFDGIDDNLFRKEIHKMTPIHSDYAKMDLKLVSGNTRLVLLGPVVTGRSRRKQTIFIAKADDLVGESTRS